MRISPRWWLLVVPMFAVLLGAPLLAGGHGISGADVAVWMAIPFAGILLSIAVMPLVAPHFWHHHYGKIAAGWGVLGALVLFICFWNQKGDVFYDLLHIMLLDYVPFIILLLGLFTIAGGIRIKGKLRGSPMLNTMMLLIGTILASLMGTTGAAMLMIRPLLRANDWRKRKVHIVVFFIFLVCNIGGCLTPLGDPPLFLGFLRGVPFTWTLHMLPSLMFLAAILLPLFYFFDRLMLSKEDMKEPPPTMSGRLRAAGPETIEPVKSRHTTTLKKDDAHTDAHGHGGSAEAVVAPHDEKFGIEGGVNFVLLALLITIILVSSMLGSGPKDGKEPGALYDAKVHAIYQPHVEKGTRRSEALNAALRTVEKPNAGASMVEPLTASAEAWKEFLEKATPKQLYQAAAVLTLALSGTHDHKHGGGESPAAGAPAAAHGEGPHGNPDLFKVDVATFGKHKIPDTMKDYADGLDGRLRALDAGVDPKAIKPAMLLDMQRSVTEVNGFRGEQTYMATKSLYISGVPRIPYPNILRDVVILLLALVSWFVTKKESRKLNGFTWEPIKEVAKLFAGIFICIVPALKILQAGVDGSLSAIVGAVSNDVGEPINASYFWFTGILSSFLDNAPTYLVFFNTAGGDAGFLSTAGTPTLLAISMGAVYMGANTYIGNAPNFMVKAIAEEGGIKMPSFFGYMLWSFLILLPLFGILTLLDFVWDIMPGMH